MQKSRSRVQSFLPWSLTCFDRPWTVFPCQLLPTRAGIAVSFLLRLAASALKLCFPQAVSRNPFWSFSCTQCILGLQASEEKMSNLWNLGHLLFEESPRSNNFRQRRQIIAGLIQNVTLKSDKPEMPLLCPYKHCYYTQMLGLNQIARVGAFDWADTFYFTFFSSKLIHLSPISAFLAMVSLHLCL